MKTTLDIPDKIFRQPKARAALRGISLRQFVAEAISENTTTASVSPAIPPALWIGSIKTCHWPKCSP